MAGEHITDALIQVERDHPGWHAWVGVGGILYARRVQTTPPKVVRAASTEGLVQQIEDAERQWGLR
jgi:hypothetical protein